MLENSPYKLRNKDYKPFVETLKAGTYNADYISWSVCWDKLKEMFPLSMHEWVMYEYDGKPYGGIIQPDGTVIIHCKISYETEDGNSYFHNEYLAVRDNRNNSVANPDSAQMENTYRRALAKGVSTLTGFGIGLWINEDIREIENYRPETHLDGTKPVPGMVTVDQSIKLDALMRNRFSTDSDKKRIENLKKISWDGLTDQAAAILIADVKQGVRNNTPATPTRKKKLKLLVEESKLKDERKTETLTWLDDIVRTNGDLDTLEFKLKGVDNDV
jgi:hypothetical protein